MVGRRHPLLIALVFIFAIGLALAPFLFMVERNPYKEAINLYRNLCEAVARGYEATLLDLVSKRAQRSVVLEAAKKIRCIHGKPRLLETDEARVYVFTVANQEEGYLKLRLVDEDGGLRWWP